MNRVSIFAYVLAPLLVSAIGFVFSPILSWWLAEEEMAKFAIFQVSVNFFILVASLGLDQALMREFNEVNSPRKLLAAALVMLGITAPVCIVALAFIKIYAYEALSESITVPMALACILMVLNRMYSSFIRMSGEGFAFAIDLVLPKLLQLTTILVLGSASLAVLSYNLVVTIIVAASVCSLLYEVVVTRRIGRRLEKPSLGANKKNQPDYADMLKFGAPLVPGAVAFYAISASSIYIIGFNGASTEVVIASLAISVGGGLAVLGTVFSTVWTPFAYRWHARAQSPELYGFIATIVVMVCSVFLLAILFVSPYLSFMFPDQYGGLTRLVVIVAAWNLLYIVSIVGSFGIGVKRMSVTSMLISTCGAVVSICASIIVNPYYGAHGVLLAVLGAFVVTLILNCEFSTRGWRRVVVLPHYVMVVVMCVSVVLFSFEYQWQSRLVLMLAIVGYLPFLCSGVAGAYALFKCAENR
ncbi:lipopolysaccharide biosynthesis protein [Stutzerimonas nitrititolerans]|uniref:lipopolysaccharide biosynthesis protein n=1 Tax=Stutzerimonas nitrititolerans TaxID=2482751 RepID=UPI0028AEA01C|nr:lipopolysaccharide biosynthesis protein [Stutzerimonas nitrititolerans]